MGIIIYGIVCGIFMMVVFGLIAGLSMGYWMGAFFIAGGFIAASIKSGNERTKKSIGEKWKAKFPDASYSYSYGDYGIAVDEKNLKIQLLEDGQHKEYPLSAVRSWRANYLSGGEIVGGGAMRSTRWL